MNVKDSQFPYTPEHGSVSYLEAMHRMTVAEARVRELEAALAASLKTIEERIPLLNRIVELEAERDKLKALAEEAIDSIEDWAGYADAYFQNKHDLQGELVRLRTTLKDSKEN